MDGFVGFALSKIEKKFPSVAKDVNLQDWIKYGTPVLVVAAMILIISWCCYCCCCQNGRKGKGRKKGPPGPGRNQRRGRNVRYD
ncbi:hypothetical protein QQ045_017230 [Rhodiola kirilowii]